MYFSKAINQNDKYFLICFLLFYTKIIQSYTTKPITDVSHLRPGIGFVSDSEYISKIECFKANNTIANKLMISIMMVSSPLSFLELSKEFGISSIDRRYQFFLHSDLFMDYLNEIYEDPFTFSFNYLMSKVGSKELLYPREAIDIHQILTEKGLEIYNNGNNNNTFRLFCGDRFVNNYSYGIALVFSIRFTFTNPYDKEKFKMIIENDVKINGFKKIVEQMGKIILYSHYGLFEDNFNGKIELLGIQMGGKANYFNYLNGKDFDNGDFVLASCTFATFEECIKSKYGVNFLKSYIDNTYFEQWRDFRKFDLNHLLVMGAVHRFFETDPLTKYGINTGNSYVDKNLEIKRKEFLSILKKQVSLFKNVKHWYAFTPFPNKKIDKYYSNLQHNIKIFLNDNAGVNCYRNALHFEECSSAITRKLKNINENEIKQFSKNLFFFDGYFDFLLSKHLCIPPIFNWDILYHIKIFWLNNKIVYIYSNNPSFTCKITNSFFQSFECTDSVLFISFTIEEKEGKTGYMTCKENNFNFEDKAILLKKKSHNLYIIH